MNVFFSLIFIYFLYKFTGKNYLYFILWLRLRNVFKLKKKHLDLTFSDLKIYDEILERNY